MLPLVIQGWLVINGTLRSSTGLSQNNYRAICILSQTCSGELWIRKPSSLCRKKCAQRLEVAWAITKAEFGLFLSGRGDEKPVKCHGAVLPCAYEDGQPQLRAVVSRGSWPGSWQVLYWHCVGPRYLVKATWLLLQRACTHENCWKELLLAPFPSFSVALPTKRWLFTTAELHLWEDQPDTGALGITLLPSEIICPATALFSLTQDFYTLIASYFDLLNSAVASLSLCFISLSCKPAREGVAAPSLMPEPPSPSSSPRRVEAGASTSVKVRTHQMKCWLAVGRQVVADVSQSLHTQYLSHQRTLDKSEAVPRVHTGWLPHVSGSSVSGDVLARLPSLSNHDLRRERIVSLTSVV